MCASVSAGPALHVLNTCQATARQVRGSSSTTRALNLPSSDDRSSPHALAARLGASASDTCAFFHLLYSALKGPMKQSGQVAAFALLLLSNVKALVIERATSCPANPPDSCSAPSSSNTCCTDVNTYFVQVNTDSAEQAKTRLTRLVDPILGYESADGPF